MHDDQLEILRQIRRRLTAVAVATSVVAAAVALPYVFALLNALEGPFGRLGMTMGIFLLAIVLFGAAMIALILRSPPSGRPVERRGFEPTVREGPSTLRD